MYYEQWFVDGLKKCMLLVNVYYFFVRQWCVPQCLSNVVGLFDCSRNLLYPHKLKWSSQKKAIELMVICYIAGAQFVPGGHQQFQMWYWDLLPLAIEMVGLPSVLTFKLFHDIFPCRIVHPIVHHNFVLLLSFWLLTAGPDVYRKLTRVKTLKVE